MWPAIVACACPTWSLRKQVPKKIWGNLFAFPLRKRMRNTNLQIVNGNHFCVDGNNSPWVCFQIEVRMGWVLGRKSLRDTPKKIAEPFSGTWFSNPCPQSWHSPPPSRATRPPPSRQTTLEKGWRYRALSGGCSAIFLWHPSKSRKT